MPTTLLHGFTSFDHMANGGVKKLPNFDANPLSTLTIITPGLSGIGQGIEDPANLAYEFGRGWDVVVCRVLYSALALTTTRDILRFGLADHSGVVTLQITAAGLLQVDIAQTDATQTVTSTGAPLTVSTTYAIEFGCSFEAGTGEVRVLIDGLEDVSLRIRDAFTQATSSERVHRIIFTNPDGQYDDFHVRVGNNGLRRTDFLSDTLGNPKFVTLFPTNDSSVDLNDFLGAADGDHHLEVDEIQADGNTSYVFADETLEIGAKESWIMRNLTVLPTKIYALGTTVMLFYNTSLFRDLRQFLAYSGAIYHAGEGELADTDYAFKSQVWEKSPKTFEDWTRNEINDAELGLELVEVPVGSFEDRVTQGVFVVLYTDGPLTTPENPATDAAKAGLQSSGHALATLLKLEREDGRQFFFTDHNASLSFQGDVYESVGGFDATARRREAALKEPNLEIGGIITSDKITTDDLRAGRFRSARLTEHLVDWRFPWGGSVQTSVYVVQECSWNGASYTAQLAGLPSLLRHAIGDVYARPCRHNLGDKGCKVQLHALTYRGVRVATVTDRRIFTANTADIHGLRPEEYFRHGVIRWRTGLNQGLAFNVKQYGTDTRRFETQLPAPFDIAVDDLFDAEPGCNWLKEGDCHDKFDNVINHGGFSYMPGGDGALETPRESGGAPAP